MDFESLERCWREDAEHPLPRLEEATLMRLIEDRAAGVRGDVRRRLRRETAYYLPMMALAGASLLAGFTLNRVVAASCVLMLLGGVMATLWRAERRIEDTPLDQSLREMLAALLAQVDGAGRAYVAAYVLVFVLAAAASTTAVWWRQGVGVPLAVVSTLAVLAVAWSVQSGRAYVERMFRRYRAELSDCLRQLEG